jgi:hypothetical protein
VHKAGVPSVCAVSEGGQRQHKANILEEGAPRLMVITSFKALTMSSSGLLFILLIWKEIKCMKVSTLGAMLGGKNSKYVSRNVVTMKFYEHFESILVLNNNFYIKPENHTGLRRTP